MILKLKNLPGPKQASYLVFLGYFLVSCGEDDVTIVDNPDFDPIVSQLVLQDEFENEKLVIYHNPLYDILVAYNRELNGKVLEFQAADSLPAVLMDDTGNYWNIFGEAISGPDKGAQLNFLNQVKAYWFSIATFYAEATLFGENVEKELMDNIKKDGWLIDTDFIVQGALPNAIPAVNDPQFTEVRTKELFIDGNHKQSDLILAVKIGGEERIYPERVLEYHEIVNDVFQSKKVAISYCPLTGTGYCWDRGDFTFFVSGLLHNANLILGDWQTNSKWSQIYGTSVFGPSIETNMEQIPIIEMNWEGRTLLTDKQRLDTGQKLPVNSPYQGYNTSNSIGYPISFSDIRLPPKEKVLAVIINGKAKVYRTVDF